MAVGGWTPLIQSKVDIFLETIHVGYYGVLPIRFLHAYANCKNLKFALKFMQRVSLEWEYTRETSMRRAARQG